MLSLFHLTSLYLDTANMSKTQQDTQHSLKQKAPIFLSCMNDAELTSIESISSFFASTAAKQCKNVYRRSGPDVAREHKMLIDLLWLLTRSGCYVTIGESSTVYNRVSSGWVSSRLSTNAVSSGIIRFFPLSSRSRKQLQQIPFQGPWCIESTVCVQFCHAFLGSVWLSHRIASHNP